MERSENDADLEQLQITRCQTEDGKIRNKERIDGAKYLGLKEKMINGECSRLFEWWIWKYKLYVEVVLPKNYPLNPPKTRLLNGWGEPADHPAVDGTTGIIRFENDDEWLPSTIAWDICTEVMALLSESQLPVFEDGTPVERIEYRHEIKLTYDEYHLLCVPFAIEFLNRLKEKYSVKFVLRGGRARAIADRRHLLVKSENATVLPTVEQKVRDYLLYVVRYRDQHGCLPNDLHETSSDETDGVDCSIDESQDGSRLNSTESDVLTNMAGVQKDTQNADLGIGRGWGRGLVPANDTPALGFQRPNPVASAFKVPHLENGARTRGHWLEECKNEMKRATNELHLRIRARVIEFNRRMDDVSMKFSKLEATAFNFRLSCQKLEEAQLQLGFLRASVFCPICNIRERKAAFGCGHFFCQPCAEAMEDRRCSTCHKVSDKIIYTF